MKKPVFCPRCGHRARHGSHAIENCPPPRKPDPRTPPDAFPLNRRARKHAASRARRAKQEVLPIRGVPVAGIHKRPASSKTAT